MDEALLKLILGIGDDAKTVVITYLVLEYGSIMIFIGLCTWGIRTLWKNRNEL